MPHFLSLQIDKLETAGAMLVSPGSILSIPAVAAALTIAACFLALRQKRRRGRVRWGALARAIMSRRVILNRSTGADLFCYFVNTFAISGLIGWGLVSGLTVSHATLRLATAAFGAPAATALPAWTLRAGITGAVFLGYEFGYYVDHLMKHKIPFLWEFHKTHHTAEALTPLTVFRVHPVDTLIFFDIVATTTGVAHGLFVYLAGRPLQIYALAGSNVLTVVCLLLLAQLQHSQFWIPLRGLAGRLVLSPAHHQLHHSADPAHYNCNLGSFLAVFDWLFGTLNLPEQRSPRLKFGVPQQGGDPHRVFALLITPFAGGLGALLRQTPQAETQEAASEPDPLTAA
jgi:sterol desaturase/sphingolipid hydroxylase (fatty acid hydroxylase superfamily)